MEEQRVVLVTGGVRRLGGTIADRLEEAGFRVIRHSRTAGDVQADLGIHEAVDALFIAALKCYGRLDAIVNNAALFTSPDAHTLRHVNTEAPLELMRYFHDYLRQTARFGSVVNILDTCVERAPKTPYEQTKYDLAVKTLAAVRPSAPHLRVNAVAPGDILPPESTHVAAKPLLLQRRPTPRDVADAVLYLIQAPAVTGQLIAVDGGSRFLEPAN
ncbi:MAG: SDR family oxidoreductase [Kiritimatiellia bacterium]